MPSASDVVTAVRAVGLTKRFGAVTAVDGVSLTVGEGEIVGLLGPNGAGRTAMGRAVPASDVFESMRAALAGGAPASGGQLVGGGPRPRLRGRLAT